MSRTSVLIISHITFRDCRVHCFSDNLSRNSCIYIFSNISEGTAFLLQGLTYNEEVKLRRYNLKWRIACNNYDTIITRENLNDKKVNVENKNRWSSDWKEIWNVKIVQVLIFSWQGREPWGRCWHLAPRLLRKPVQLRQASAIQRWGPDQTSLLSWIHDAFRQPGNNLS